MDHLPLMHHLHRRIIYIDGSCTVNKVLKVHARSMQPAVYENSIHNEKMCLLQELAQLMGRVDFDRNGTLDLEEFISGLIDWTEVLARPCCLCLLHVGHTSCMSLG